MSAITVVAASVLAVVFGWGGIAKLIRYPEWKEVLQSYSVPVGIHRVAALLVPIAELSVVALLLVGRARAGAALTLALLALFSRAFVAAAHQRGGRVACGCFGKAAPHDYRLLLARNASLTICAGIVLIYGHDRLSPLPATDPGFLLPGAIVLLGLSLALVLARELQALRRQ